MKEHNQRFRNSMKVTYDQRHRVDEERMPKVEDRVYVLSLNEKARNTHPNLVCEWAASFRVLETSQDSALLSRIGERQN